MHRSWRLISGLFLLVAALASCDEEAPTETDEPAAQQTELTSASGAEEAALVSQSGVSAAVIALPVNQSVATTAPAPAFRVNQTGTGPNGIFQISRSTSTQTALQGLTNGRGRAGFFQITNTANTQPALQAQTNGPGFAVQGLTTGTGSAGSFQINNASNSNAALTVSTNGTGIAGRFENTKASLSSTLVAFGNNLGSAFAAMQTGVGLAGFFEISNLSNTSPALQLRHNGFGPALVVTRGASAFNGNVTVNGTLTKSAGSFKIDHPLDPEHKYLSHSFIESPDMMNVYNGNVTLDASGRATVELPEYFEALNRDFRYQLTAIGSPGPSLYIAEGVKQNRFRISGGRAYGRVSWQVTGVRQDAYAEQHRIQVEQEKPRAERDLASRP